MKERTPYQIKKDRVYEIYGISKQERKKYSCHHCIFKSDKKNYPEFKDFDIDKISNLTPLLREDHRRLHEKVGSD